MHQQKLIAILGSTGSIGTQTLEVIDAHPDRFKATVLVAGTKVDTLILQSIQRRPLMAIIADESKYTKLRDALAPYGIQTAAGAQAIEDVMGTDMFDTVVTATVGYSGLAPTLRAIAAGKDIALANKETLVVAGDLVMSRLRESDSRLLPVDSEHSAIWQCLVGENPDMVNRLIITASGGPFRTWKAEDIARAKASDALRHPNWSMGAKITVDSASMLNKAFEIIEARWLFDMAAERITAVVHPQSIVHSMVEFTDGAIKAQLGIPDMKLPICYALGESERLISSQPRLSLQQMSQLTFERPDTERFPALSLAYLSLQRGGNTACVINAANEVAVAAFLRDIIPFGAIYEIILLTLQSAQYVAIPAYSDFVQSNKEARTIAESLINQFRR